MSQYPDKEFPWTFYFNGVDMPKWSWCWEFVDVGDFKDAVKSWDSDLGSRDIYILKCRIDHVGTIESADPDIFQYSIQEVLCVLLDKRESVFEKIRNTPNFPADSNEVYSNLVEAAFRMRELTIRDGFAFWTRGYESDRLRLVEAVRRASLAQDNPDYAPPPHIRSLRNQLKSLRREQAKALHRIASSGGLTKELRKRLLDISGV